MRQNLYELANNIRKDIIEMTYNAKKNGSHLGGALSSADILAVLYGLIMRHNPQNPNDPERDRFLLSKGHAAVALYAALHQTGYISDEECSAFEQNESKFPAHCVLNRDKGVELSSGSLGLGLSFGAGTALAVREKGLSSRVFVLMGNGECNEGSVWEAAAMAAHLKLANLTAVIDHNEMQLDGTSAQILNMDDLRAKFSAFNWYAADVDGNDIDKLIEAFEEMQKVKDRPCAVIAHTVKGKGISFMENNKEWHHSWLNEENYNSAMRELER